LSDTAIEARVDAAEKRLDVLELDSKRHGESIAGVRAQVMAYAAFGSLVGGALVTILAKVVK
jgi:hypothetical protein